MSTRTLILAVFCVLALFVTITYAQEPTTQEAAAAKKTMVLSVMYVSIIVNVLSRVQSDVRTWVASRRKAIADGTPIPAFDWPTFGGQIVDGAASGFLSGIIGGSIGSSIATS